jgi:hypothetical protein
MFKKNLNAHGSFTPTTVVPPPNAITPEQVLRHYRKAQAWVKGGDRHCPLLSSNGSKRKNYQKIKRDLKSDIPCLL